jgi:hypothetical protein
VELSCATKDNLILSDELAPNNIAVTFQHCIAGLNLHCIVGNLGLSYIACMQARLPGEAAGQGYMQWYNMLKAFLLR